MCCPSPGEPSRLAAGETRLAIAPPNEAGMPDHANVLCSQRLPCRIQIAMREQLASGETARRNIATR